MKPGRLGRACVTALVAGLVVLAADASVWAAAGSRVCRQLEAQLASAPAGSAQGRKYDRAIDRQREQMSIARQQARKAGCGFALAGRKVRQCASLNATIDRMAGNLDELERTRGGLGGAGGKARTRLLAAIEANNCRGGQEEEVVIRRPRDGLVRERRLSLLEQLLGGGRDAEPIDRPDPEELEREASVRITTSRGTHTLEDDTQIQEPVAPPSQTYNTMCVRTCDGYFFPMSQAAAIGDFDRDLKNCESACPGAEMQVFYRDTGSGEDLDMVSATTGRAYSELPSAYLYKEGATPRPATCGCNAPRNFEVIAGNPPPPEPTEAVALPALVEPVPVVAEPAPAALPSVDAREIDRSLAGRAVAPAALPTARKIRVVGPAFLPDQAAATVPPAPAPKGVQ